MSKEIIKNYIEALEENNKLLREKKEDIDSDEKMEDTLPKGIAEEMEDEPKREEEGMDEEEPTQMEKLVHVVGALAEKINLMESRFKEEAEDEPKKEEMEDEKSESVEEEEPKKEELGEEEKKESADPTAGVDSAKDNGMVTTTGVDPKDNPEEPEAGEDQNKDGNVDKIVKHESVDEEKESLEEEPKSEAVEDEEKKEAVEDEESKSEAVEEDDKKSEAAEDEEKSEEEPQAPMVEGISKIKISKKFVKPGLKESMRKMKLMN